METKKAYGNAKLKLYNYCAEQSAYLEGMLKAKKKDPFIEGQKKTLDEVIAICKERNRF